MNKIVLMLLIFSPLSFSKNVTDDIINYFDEQISTTQDLRQKNALIKSQADLDFYSGLNDKSFPLNLLNDKDKQVFIESLKFNDKGLTTFDYQVLEGLKHDDMYKVLSLFGFENNTDFILKPESKMTCTTMMKCGDHQGYECKSRGTCEAANGMICTSNS